MGRVLLVPKEADRGFADAEAKVGSAYALGKGVKRDYVQAYAWFDVAVKQGKHDREPDDNALARDAVAKHLTAAQVASAKRQSGAIQAKLEAR